MTRLANISLDNKRRGLLLAFGGMLSISTDSLFIRVADAEGFDVTFWVGVFTAIVMTSVIVFHQRTTPLVLARRDGWVLLVAAGLQATMTTFFVLAVKNTSVSNVVVIIAASPLFAAGFGWLWLREKTSRRVWISIAVSVMGILIVMSGSIGGGSFGGDVLAVGAIATFALGIVLLRRYPGISRTMVVGLGGAIMATVAVWPAQITGHNTETWLSLLAMGAVFGPLARVMLASAPRFLSAAEVGLFAPVETVFASFWAFLVFSEVPVAATWIGGGIVLGALLWGTSGSSSAVS
jgi:drug/metabolite transporter (DMT)-like permease